MNKTEIAFGRLYEIIGKLRAPDGCPWDREQDHKSIRGNMIEEAYEVADAIDRLYKDDALAHFAANFPAERKRFSWPTMCDKLVEVYEKTK